MICNYCWKKVEELFPSDDDYCLDCHGKLTQSAFSDEAGISFKQVKWLVSAINEKNCRITEIETENRKLKGILESK